MFKYIKVFISVLWRGIKNQGQFNSLSYTKNTAIDIIVKN